MFWQEFQSANDVQANTMFLSEATGHRAKFNMQSRTKVDKSHLAVQAGKKSSAKSLRIVSTSSDGRLKFSIENTYAEMHWMFI
jgi:hypothetical protein